MSLVERRRFLRTAQTEHMGVKEAAWAFIERAKARVRQLPVSLPGHSNGHWARSIGG